MTRRLLITALILLTSAAYIAAVSKTELVPLAQELSTFPLQIGEWQGRDLPPLEPKVLEVLGADDYLNRAYFAAGQPWVALYTGYYASQRQGDTMHSPLNCMPGAGWVPIRQQRSELEVGDATGVRRTVTVNEFIIQKGLEKQVVVYWYQAHGRVVASEYVGRALLVYDAMRLNRTDGAMVRVVTPIVGDDATAELAAAQRARQFAQGIFPALTGVLPS